MKSAGGIIDHTGGKLGRPWRANSGRAVARSCDRRAGRSFFFLRSAAVCPFRRRVGGRRDSWRHSCVTRSGGRPLRLLM